MTDPIEYSITLDVQKAHTQCFLNMVKGDTDSVIKAAFTNGRTPYDLTGKTVVFAAIKPDGTCLYENATITNGKAVYECDVQLCTVKGLVLAQFIIMEGTSIKKSPQFFVVVNANADTERALVEPSTSTVGALNNLYAYFQTMINSGAFNGVSCTHSWDGTTLTVTSASGTSSANLKGAKGDKGDKGDTGSTKVTTQVPVVVATGQPDTSSSAWSNLNKGEFFYTYDSTHGTRLFYVKEDNTHFLRVGTAGGEYCPIVNYTTNYQGKKIPDVTDETFKLLLPGQMFLCETETEIYKRWIKGGVSEAYNYEEDIRTQAKTAEKMDLIPFISSGAADIAPGQIFRYQGALYFRTGTGAVPITTGTEIPL